MKRANNTSVWCVNDVTKSGSRYKAVHVHMLEFSFFLFTYRLLWVIVVVLLQLLKLVCYLQNFVFQNSTAAFQFQFQLGFCGKVTDWFIEPLIHSPTINNFIYRPIALILFILYNQLKCYSLLEKYFVCFNVVRIFINFFIFKHIRHLDVPGH